MNATISLSAAASDFLVPLLTQSLGNAFCITFNNVPLPDKKIAFSLSLILFFAAIFNPINVFPAPGTPVKNIIDFSLFLFVLSIIFTIVCSVLFKNTSSEEKVPIFLSSCFAYICRAASNIVGVGE